MIVRPARSVPRLLTAALLAAALVVGGCRRAPGAGHEAAEAPLPPPENGAPRRLALSADAAARAGIRTEVAVPAAGGREIDAFATVLDPLPLLAARHALAAARACADTAGRELERMLRLRREDENASARDVEAARAALATATAALADATARLRLGWGPLADAGDALAGELLDGTTALARIDLPPGAHLTAPPAAAVAVTAAADPTLRATARLVGRAPATDPALQGESWLAALPGGQFAIGMVLMATLAVDGAATGVAVPVAAVVWVDAAPAVYLMTAADEVERRQITVAGRDRGRWIVTAGLAPGDRIVTEGTARLFSAELFSASAAAD
ncbi:MAG: hypothetical protein B6D46_14505 [Polyangiaceae bacterium UTPRO1]|jgi:hypothetical protein|nr:hypothetical protein [Myxococcales bacterium]OQY65148.1 MAG: hypothetical protein B6D46_14505 [Polyangiaceae bacterium UTPRO1]